MFKCWALMQSLDFTCIDLAGLTLCFPSGQAWKAALWPIGSGAEILNPAPEPMGQLWKIQLWKKYWGWGWEGG